MIFTFGLNRTLEIGPQNQFQQSVRIFLLLQIWARCLVDDYRSPLFK